ncbi:MAG: helix-turn-helix domain-containing protein [Spirochaetota bacterium]
MKGFQWSESLERPRLSDEQKRLIFQTIQQRGGTPDCLPDFRRLVRRAEAKVAKTKTAMSKLRHLNYAIAELDLLRREAFATFRSLEAAGAIDDPVVFWDYIESLDHAGVSLLHQTESLALDLEGQSMPEQASDAALHGEVEVLRQPHGSEIMDVDEVSAYLNVSKSTVYHLSAAGNIPVSRIGARLAFMKANIDEWLKASA